MRRLHREFGQSDIGRMVDILRQPTVRPTILAASESMIFDPCQGQCTFISLTGGKWKTCRTWSGAADDHFYRKHPTLEIHTHKRDSVGGDGVSCHRGSHLEDISSYREPGKRLIGGTRTMLQECSFQYYGRLMAVVTDQEGCFREKLGREWLASKNVRWDPQPSEAVWRIAEFWTKC